MDLSSSLYVNVDTRPVVGSGLPDPARRSYYRDIPIMLNNNHNNHVLYYFYHDYYDYYDYYSALIDYRDVMRICNENSQQCQLVVAMLQKWDDDPRWRLNIFRELKPPARLDTFFPKHNDMKGFKCISAPKKRERGEREWIVKSWNSNCVMCVPPLPCWSPEATQNGTRLCRWCLEGQHSAKRHR